MPQTFSPLQRLSRNWRRMRSLTLAELRTLPEAIVLVLLARRRLHSHGLSSFRKRLASVERPGALGSDPVRLARIVEGVSARMPGSSNCLQRSAAVAWMLARRGFDPDLRLGVGRVDGELRFHAWVELAGRVVNDAPDVGARYTPFGGAAPPPDAVFTG